MGQRCSSYFVSNDVVHVESDDAKATQMETKKEEYNTCDNDTFTKNDIASHKQDSQSNACSTSAVSVDTMCDANNTSSATSATDAVMSSERTAEHQPWFLAHMTEEHWERLNMMCIVSPSSS